MNGWTHLSEHLSVFHGAGNVGVVRDGDRVLVIDPSEDVGPIDTALVTHYHRDGMAALPPDARLLAPASEAHLIADAEAYWAAPTSRWHAYHYRPFFQVPAASRPVAGTLADGDTLTWGAARITALATPGHTDGSLSYLVEVDGRRVCFTGDLLYAPGQLWDLHSLQQGGRFPEGEVWDYHGFLGAREALAAGMARVTAAELLVPAHGMLMPEPQAAVQCTLARLDALYRNYASTSALHHYMPFLFAGLPAGDTWGTTAAPPAWLTHDSTTWTLHSADGAVFVMDCGSEAVVDALRRAGRPVEGLWITHYHDDHVDGVPAFQAAFPCPLHADASVAAVIRDPAAWRLPCLSPAVCRVDHVTGHGESWTWREFTLTAYHFPGQTLYHGGLLVEGRGRRLFFVGDSFAPSGMDDYCPLNRNSLGAGTGFDACLALLQAIRPDGLLNPHVDTIFSFTDAALRTMRDRLAARVELLAALSPWPAPDFALDPFWARLHPCGATAELVVTNAAAQPLPVRANWTGDAARVQADVPPGTEVRLPMPAQALPAGRHVRTADLTVGGRRLPCFTECLLVVE
jgi:glyoxylase-like metal-dependent hydrolase (beta-lactamase superfamily II)